MPDFFLKPLIGVLLAMCLGPVWAHSFNLGLVAPMSGPEAVSGKQALDGFMLATTEQDAHAFEESDGHLGGLDSYVIKIDSSGNDKTTIDRIENLLRSKKPIFVAGIFSQELASRISDRLENSEAVLVNPADSAKWKQVAEMPEQLTTMDSEPFDAAFESAYGYAANANVRQGYIAARLIASTVRSLAESGLKDRDELARALSQFQQE